MEGDKRNDKDTIPDRIKKRTAARKVVIFCIVGIVIAGFIVTSLPGAYQ